MKKILTLIAVCAMSTMFTGCAKKKEQKQAHKKEHHMKKDNDKKHKKSMKKSCGSCHKSTKMNSNKY